MSVAQNGAPHGLRAPPPPGRRAVPAGPRARRRHRRVRRRRARRRGRGPARHHRRTAAGWPPWSSPPTSSSGSSRRTPTPCCCRSSPRSTGSASRSSTGSTWPTRPPAARSRLRPAAADLDDARRGAVRRHPGRAPRPPRAAAVHLHPRPGRHRAAPAADASRSSARTINGARIWINVGPFSFQPGEVAKVLLVIAFAGYLVLHRDALALAGRRVLFVDLPRGRDLGPILAMWLVSLGILVFQRDLGSQPAVLRPVPDRCSTSPPSGPGGWWSAAACSSPAALVGVPAVRATCQTRVNFWLDPFELLRREPAAAARSSRRCSAWRWGGLIGRGFGERHARADPVRRVRLHRRRDRRGARPDRA